MPNFDTHRIFNESPGKVLRREYENLKQDFTKLNAIKYKGFYENAPLSVLIENSQCIFSEPFRGLEFYKSLMENATLPWMVVLSERDKVSSYFSEYADKMSDVQRTEYQALLESMNQLVESRKHSISMYSAMMENADSIMEVYDDLYEYTRDNSHTPDKVMELFEDTDMNLLDVMNIAIRTPELHSTAYQYLEQCYIESPQTVEDYRLNSYVSNVMLRMMRDSYVKEAVNALPNMNLRHLICGIAGVKGVELIENITTERVSDVQANYVDAQDMVNRFFEEDEYSEAASDINMETKLNRLNGQIAVCEMSTSFLNMDAMSDILLNEFVDPIVEQVCIESSTLEKIPQDFFGQITVLTEKVNELRSQIDVIEEKYFHNGEPNAVIARSLGETNKDKTEMDATTYSPKKPPLKKDETSHDVNSEADTADDPDDDDDPENIEVLRRANKKQRATDKYAAMDIDSDEFAGIAEATEVYELAGGKIKEAMKSVKTSATANLRQDRSILDSDLKFNKSPDFKSMYEGWDYACQCKNMASARKTALKIAQMYKGSFGMIPKFTLVTGAAFKAEYGKLRDGVTEDTVFVVFPYKGIPKNEIAVWKKTFGARYFTDIVDNAVRIFMMLDKNYKPKSYIDMDNIKAADKYLKSVAEFTMEAGEKEELDNQKKNSDVEHKTSKLSWKEKREKMLPKKAPKAPKKPFMQKVQDGAHKANMKMKSAMATGKQNLKKGLNVGKTIAKIPGNITASLKSLTEHWEEMDDNKRKEYILKPGVRKKYFKALRIAISHGIAFAINPILNIILACSNYISAQKDIRIRNEFVRELKAEIEVTKAKIEDASNDPDRNVRYKLIRIQQKLEAELARVSTNAKYI